ncbi:DUF2927 domain-containing protein [Phaeobacter sp. HF9A]|uniref:DUF2927 domain-containing protein n=1 Tax=Phaeobacter sp. HF9A TaxID=2721561 RepID=UPI001431519A|nr:DUF2927 domain-containing protein [Phaeobacter sp. HF9A]NIZ15514.1 DUF2927 domain-containing protein [Phaeobacter sp. HF9A]
MHEIFASVFDRSPRQPPRRGALHLAAILALTLAACSDGKAPPSRASSQIAQPLPPIRAFPTQRPTPPQRSNADMARDFLDLHFQLEGGSQLPVFTRFEGPVTLTVRGRAPATLTRDLQALLHRLRTEAGLDLHLVPDTSPARITIEPVSRARIQRVLPQAACFVVPNVSSLEEYRRNRRAPQSDWTALRHRERLAIFVPDDVSPQELRDCLHEELAQALGPLNDLYRLPDSIFNDDNVHSVLTGFDMLMLRATYDPALRTGMSRAEVAARLPGILARLNPRGEARASAPLPATPRSWISAVETALSGHSSEASSRRAAHEVARIARAQGWQDHRRAFAHFLLGRAEQARDPRLADDHFRTALRYLAPGPDSADMRALIQARLAAYALREGHLAEVAPLLEQAIPAARRGQNAALLSTLLLLKARLADIEGNRQDATALRGESLGWALYGLGLEASGIDQLRKTVAGRG